MRRRTPRIPFPPAHDGGWHNVALAFLPDGSAKCASCGVILSKPAVSSPAPAVSQRPSSPFGSTEPFAAVAFGSITPEHR